MEIEQYDTVLLKDGREAAIVEKFSDTDFLADVGDSPKDWETISVTASDIERVLSDGRRVDRSETIQARIERLNTLFAEKYGKFTWNGRPFFIPETENAVAFAVDSFSDRLVLEYAETMRDVTVNRLEDGDCFPVDMTEKAMYRAMIREIEGITCEEEMTMSEQYLGADIRKLGFGLMRLPQNDGVFDLEQIKQMVDRFLAAGFTYFDTAFVYTGSEDVTRQALVERYPREKFQLATKNAAWLNCKTREDAVAQFETSLKRTGAGYFDFYLLHNLGEQRTHFFDDFDLWEFVQEKKREGLIRHAGFSFHSTPEELDAILTAHPEAEFVQLQINYADWDNPAIQSRACYEVARKHGKPVVIMEPVKGGMLASPPDSVTEILKAAEPDSSPASWAVRFAANLPGVITVLSGMSSLAQMDDNLAAMRDFTGLTDAQQETMKRAQAALNAIPLIPCTTCNYCAKVCPNDIGISGTFTAMNVLTLYRNMEKAIDQEHWHVGGEGHKSATQCIQCGACMEVCPQHIAIPDELTRCCEALGLKA